MLLEVYTNMAGKGTVMYIRIYTLRYMQLKSEFINSPFCKLLVEDMI
jgi:hypothetical protein